MKNTKIFFFFLNWGILLLFSKVIVSFLFSILLEKGVVVVGNNLQNYIWSLFLFTFFLALLATTFGATLTAFFLFSANFFLKFYAESFKKYSTEPPEGFFIEIPGDLVLAVSSFFLLYFLLQVFLASSFKKTRYFLFAISLTCIFFFVPSIYSAAYLVLSFLFLDFFFFLKKSLISLNRGRVELPTSPSSGARSTNWATGSKK